MKRVQQCQVDRWLDWVDTSLPADTKHKTGIMLSSLKLRYEEVVLSCSVISDSLQLCGLTVAYQAPLSIGFSRHEYWSGLPFPPPEIRN